MTAVMVELTPTRSAEDTEEVVLIDDLDAYTSASQPGCNDDNPYT